MKQKYTITVADMELNILSDASADDVTAIATILDRRMKETLQRSPRCSKSEAAILCALSYCAERQSMQEAFKKVEKDAFRYAGENEKLKKTVEHMQEELDNLRRDAEVMRAVLDRAAAAQPQSEKNKFVPKAPVRKPVREATQLSAFDTFSEEEASIPQPTAPVPAARPVVTEEPKPEPVQKAVAPEAPEAPAAAEDKTPKKGKKDNKGKSHIGSMFDLLTFSDV